MAQKSPEQVHTELDILKAQLKTALQNVEAAEEALAPKTSAELDELEKKLNAALDEVKGRKAELQKKQKS